MANIKYKKEGNQITGTGSYTGLLKDIEDIKKKGNLKTSL